MCISKALISSARGWLLLEGWEVLDWSRGKSTGPQMAYLGQELPTFPPSLPSFLFFFLKMGTWTQWYSTTKPYPIRRWVAGWGHCFSPKIQHTRKAMGCKVTDIDLSICAQQPSWHRDRRGPQVRPWDWLEVDPNKEKDLGGSEEPVGGNAMLDSSLRSPHTFRGLRLGQAFSRRAKFGFLQERKQTLQCSVPIQRAIVHRYICAVKMSWWGDLESRLVVAKDWREREGKGRDC